MISEYKWIYYYGPEQGLRFFICFFARNVSRIGNGVVIKDDTIVKEDDEEEEDKNVGTLMEMCIIDWWWVIDKDWLTKSNEWFINEEDMWLMMINHV